MRISHLTPLSEHLPQIPKKCRDWGWGIQLTSESISKNIPPTGTLTASEHPCPSCSLACRPLSSLATLCGALAGRLDTEEADDEFLFKSVAYGHQIKGVCIDSLLCDPTCVAEREYYAIVCPSPLGPVPLTDIIFSCQVEITEAQGLARVLFSHNFFSDKPLLWAGKVWWHCLGKFMECTHAQYESKLSSLD